MKLKWIALTLVAIFGLATAVAAQADNAEETAAFLQKNYGWTVDQRKLSGGSWEISCDSSRVALPETGKNIFRGWVCRQQDKSYWTVVFWRLPSVKPEAVQRLVYNGMADGLGYGNVTCARETPVVQGEPRGFIEDCTVPLQNGTFYASFYHFESPAPSPYTIDGRSGPVVRKVLAFTVWIQNAGNSDTKVKERLRELIAMMRFPPTVPASDQK